MSNRRWRLLPRGRPAKFDGAYRAATQSQPPARGCNFRDRPPVQTILLRAVIAYPPIGMVSKVNDQVAPFSSFGARYAAVPLRVPASFLAISDLTNFATYIISIASSSLPSRRSILFAHI